MGLGQAHESLVDAVAEVFQHSRCESTARNTFLTVIETKFGPLAAQYHSNVLQCAIRSLVVSYSNTVSVLEERRKDEAEAPPARSGKPARKLGKAEAYFLT